jgi:hypothetical protein
MDSGRTHRSPGLAARKAVQASTREFLKASGSLSAMKTRMKKEYHGRAGNGAT